MAYASLLACSSSQQPNLRRRRAWRFPHSCPDASSACRIERRTISPVGEQLSSLRTSEGNDMKIDGRCHCDYVRFGGRSRSRNDDYLQLHGLPNNERCTVASDRCHSSTFVLLSGKPTEYRKTADSGNIRLQAFCPHCGTPIYATSTGDEPKAYNVRLGSLRQRNELVPRSVCLVPHM